MIDQRPCRGVHFKDQAAGETVLLLLRRDFITNTAWLLVAFLAFLLPIFFWLAPYQRGLPFLNILPARYLLFLSLVWYQFLSAFILISFSGWFFNIDLVTSQRILDIDYWGFLYFNVAETPLANIQDVTYNISGLPATIFDYGDVYIQTAAKEAKFEFSQVPSPAAVHDLVTNLLPGER